MGYPRLTEVGLYQFNSACLKVSLDVFSLAAGQVIHDPDRSPLFNQGIDQMGTDKGCSPGD
jgi:hypothetical protein